MDKNNTIIQLNDYPKDKYNVLIPVSTMQVMSNMQKVIVNQVTLDTSNNSKDIYKEKTSGKYAITKVGGMKLAAAANISVVDTVKGKTDACSRCIDMAKAVGKAKACGACPRANDISVAVTIRVPEPSGSFRMITATKEIECETQAKLMSEKQYQRFFEHRYSIAESKAFMRAIRSALGLSAGYDWKELRKPFVIAHIVPNLDDPAIKDAVANNYLQSMGMLFETPHQPMAALPPQTQNVENIIEPDDEPDESLIEEYGPAPSEYDGPVCEECGTLIESTSGVRGKQWTPEDIAQYSKRVYGRCLCFECQKREKR